MKLVTFELEDGTTNVGVLSDDDLTIVPLSQWTEDAAFRSMQSLIEAGPSGLDHVRNAIESAAAGSLSTMSRSSVRLLAPLPLPIQIRDVLCFLDHLRNAGRTATAMRGADPDSYVVPDAFVSAPRYYKANRMAVIGTNQDIQWPAGCEMLDYELELGIIIGRKGKDIAVEEALDHVFGYTIFNDVSARDLQMEEMASGLGPAKGKDFDTGNIFGPCIVTADAVDPRNITMTARLNGEQLSQGNTSQMDHSVAEAVAYVSRNETLHPGEILGSGTVPLGCLLEHGRSLTPGDLIEFEVEGIGILRNRVGARS